MHWLLIQALFGRVSDSDDPRVDGAPVGLQSVCNLLVPPSRPLRKCWTRLVEGWPSPVEGSGLENRQGREALGGSNPPPSATLFESRHALRDAWHSLLDTP